MRSVTMPEQVIDAGAVAVFDGRDGIGQVLAATAMREAVSRAKTHGIGAAAVRNSNHFGTAAYWTRLAPPEGCIGLLTTNASPAMAPWGGRDKRVGNNPWSIAAPAGRFPPMVLDIANTVVARGKVYLARERGERLPHGWAIDEDGVPTSDPAAALAGLILPMAGHKGYAISVMLDVLSGVLSGSSFGSAVRGPYFPDGRSGCGHLAIALNIAAFLPPAEFEVRIEALIKELTGVRLAQGFERVYYPGQIEALNAEDARRDGIGIAAESLRKLDLLASEVGIDGLCASKT
jgi:LDH2 family malate/lactate/ureidoglycolate dehydrogenase